MKVTQIRLGPARLTHCMRWLGLAEALRRDRRRVCRRARAASACSLADRESVQLMLGEAGHGDRDRPPAGHEGGLGARPRRLRAQGGLDGQDPRRRHAARGGRRGIQINGARGYSKDTVLEWIYRYARQARLVDGADEVHRMVLSQELAAEGSDFWRWPVAVV